MVVTQDFDLSSADSTSSQGNVSRMSIDREFLAMEIDELKDHRYIRVDNEGWRVDQGPRGVKEVKC